MGRPRKPTVLHRLDGTYRKDRHGNGDEPVFTTDGVGENPFDKKIQKAAFDEWNRLAPNFITLGLLNVSSLQVFKAYCLCVWEKSEADRDIAKRGVYIEETIFSRATGEPTGTREVKNPSLKMSHDSGRLAHRLLVEFGGTPATRAKVTVKKDAVAASKFRDRIAARTKVVAPNLIQMPQRKVEGDAG
jgi:phage terminase small subunit